MLKNPEKRRNEILAIQLADQGIWIENWNSCEEIYEEYLNLGKKSMKDQKLEI
jgi:hypothetical protein